MHRQVATCMCYCRRERGVALGQRRAHSKAIIRLNSAFLRPKCEKVTVDRGSCWGPLGSKVGITKTALGT
jgi:hypothetical protein